MSGKLKRTLLIAATVVAITIAMIWTKVYFSSRSELKKADQSLKKGDLEAARLHLRRAIQWYSPFSGPVKQAVKTLWKLALSQEKSGKKKLALKFYRTLRSSLYAVRHITTPFENTIKACEEKIATLISRQKAATPEDKVKSAEERRKEHLALLRTDTAPNVFWSIFLLLGFIIWVGGTVCFIFRGFTREGELRGRPALLWGLTVVAGFAMWVIGLTQA